MHVVILTDDYALLAVTKTDYCVSVKIVRCTQYFATICFATGGGWGGGGRGGGGQELAAEIVIDLAAGRCAA